MVSYVLINNVVISSVNVIFGMFYVSGYLQESIGAA